MKKYSTSKLLVVFVVVSLLSLSYAFAGKPVTYSWSVYIPADPANGLQGDVAVYNEDLNMHVYAYEDPETTRNFVNFINHKYSYFNFEILPAGIDELTVKLNIADETEWDDFCEGETDSCDGMLNQFKMEQPNGESISDYHFTSQRIFFGFGSGSGYNYERQEIYDFEIDEGEIVRLGGYFYIDSSFWGTPEDPQPFDYTIKGDFVGEYLWVVRVNPNTWRIFGYVPKIVAAHREEEFDHTECWGSKKNPTCRDIYRVETKSEGEITFEQDEYIIIDLYFLREPAQ